MKKLTLIIFVMVFISISVSACGSGNGNSTKGGYIVFQSSRPHATHWGGFKKWNVQTKMKGHKLSSVSFVVDMTSLYTEDDFATMNKNLDTVQNFKQNDPKAKTEIQSLLTDHLNGVDFLNTATYRQATFKSTSITENPAIPDTYIVTGPLTIMGQTEIKTVKAKVSKVNGKEFATADFDVNQDNLPMKKHEYMEKIYPLVQVQVKIPLP